MQVMNPKPLNCIRLYTGIVLCGQRAKMQRRYERAGVQALADAARLGKAVRRVYPASSAPHLACLHPVVAGMMYHFSFQNAPASALPLPHIRHVHSPSNGRGPLRCCAEGRTGVVRRQVKGLACRVTAPL